MQCRPFGKTGFKGSEIGFGTWAMGGSMWAGQDDYQAKKALHFALDLGVNFFDTAYVYGNGHSEQLIGEVLRERKIRDQLFIATKVPPKNYQWPAKAGSDVTGIFPRKWIREMTETSLKNLGLETVDLQQLHVWSANWFNQGDWFEEFQKLKQEGKIRWFGVSINDHQPDTALELVESGLTDSVQVIYNIFDQSPEEKLFPLCQEKQVAVIARVPFDEGGLTDTLTPETKFSKKDWRKHYFKGDRLKETCDRVDRLKQFLNDDDLKAIPALALKYCLSHPAVSNVIPGMRRPQHVEANCAVSDGKPLSTELLQEIRKHAWPRNFYPHWNDD